MRVDAHQHYWRFDATRDAWITPEMSIIRRDFLPHDAEPLLRSAGIDGVVAVQADQSESETRFLLDLAARHPVVAGVVGWIDLFTPDLRDQLDVYRAHTALKGFRHIAQSEADDFLARADVIAAVTAIGAAGFSYDVLVHPHQLAAAIALVAACPDVRFVLDHCAKPPIANGNLAAWRADFDRLAHYPNVSCKLSGLVTEARWNAWKDADIVPVLDAALNAFEPERLMFASDWPVCLLATEYERWTNLVERWAAPLSESERAFVFGETATRVYGLNAPASA
jgi:L-fuconolactonase